MKHKLRRTGMILFAGSLTAVLAGPFLIPVPPLKGTFPAKTLADDDSEFIDINGVNVHLKKRGQGKPVFLLLHGFAASLYSWQRVMEPFSQLGMVIAFDRPGFGLSEHPLGWQGKNPYSADAQTELVVGLLDHFQVDQAILVGSSAGGSISMRVALQHPQRVAGLVLVDAAVYVGSHAPRWLSPIFSTPQMHHLGPLIARQITRLGPRLIDIAWHDPSRMSDEMLELYRKPYQVEDWDNALWELTLANRQNDLPKHLSEIDLPTLVITGDDDSIVPTADSIRLAGELPHASLKVIQDCGHLPHEEQPEEFMQAVRSFLETLPEV
jgi:pimeloyl-ACP methyl ester carboxylesterase